MLCGLVFIEILLLFHITKSIYVYNPGNPHENLSADFLDVNADHRYIAAPSRMDYSEKYEYPSSFSEKYMYPYGNVDKDYGIMNMSLFGLENPEHTTSSTRLTDKTKMKNRVGFYNVQTGDEFFLNDFAVRPKFKTKQNNKEVIRYEYSVSEAGKRKDKIQSQKNANDNKLIKNNPKYQQNTTRRPLTNNNRKGNKTTNKRRKPNLQSVTQPPRRNNRKPLTNRNKNTVQNNRNKNKNTQKTRRKVQQQHNIKTGCRHPSVPLKNSNRRPQKNKVSSNKKQTIIRKKQPIRKVNNRKQNNRYANKHQLQNNLKRKPNNRFKTIQSRKDTSVSDVIKRYLLRLKSNNTLDGSTRDFNDRKRSLFGITFNRIREQSVDFANKFFSLFTVVQHQNYECTADSELSYYEGVCYQENQCLKLGGTVFGKCENFGSCCILRATCGESSSQNCSYFESPLYPDYFPANGTDIPDLNLDTSYTDFPTEESTETFLQHSYQTDESTDEEFYTDFSYFGDSTTETPPGNGDEFFVDTDLFKEMPYSDDPTYDDSLAFDTFTEGPFEQNFDVTEDLPAANPEYASITVDSGNKYKEYALAKESNFVENYACMFRVFKMSDLVQQMKIEFLDLELMGPDARGDCINEKLMISGQNINSQIPIICGYNSGQHVYVDVSLLTGPLQISILSNNVYRKRYKIRVCQLETPCVNSMNCLQYYTNHQGIISSFNYDQAVAVPRSEPQYLNNLNYAICIRKDAGYCSITFTNIDEENVEYPFDIENTSRGKSNVIQNQEFAKEYTDCPDDFILINNMRLCGQNFQTITDTRPGPTIMIPVQTNDRVTGMGFKLLYSQNRCTS